VEVSWIDEFDGGVGWQAQEFLRRTSHALADGGGQWRTRWSERLGPI